MSFPEIVLKVIDLVTAGPFADEEGEGFLDPSKPSTMRSAHDEYKRIGKPLQSFLESLTDETVLKLYILMEAGETKVSPADFSLLRERLHRPNRADAIRRTVERRGSLGIYLSRGLTLLERSQLDAEGYL